MIGRIYRRFHHLLHHPLQVFWICCALSITGVVLDGTAFQLWSLKRDHRLLAEKISAGKQRSQQLKFRLQMAERPEFIEKAARDQFDLVKEGDLIFIFSDETNEPAKP